MDVTSPYTNIPQEEGIHTVCKAYEAFYENDMPIPTNLQLTNNDNSKMICNICQRELTKEEININEDSGIINLLIDGFAYNTRGHFAHCSHFSSPLQDSEKYYATRKASARIICKTID